MKDLKLGEVRNLAQHHIPPKLMELTFKPWQSGSPVRGPPFNYAPFPFILPGSTVVHPRIKSLSGVVTGHCLTLGPLPRRPCREWERRHKVLDEDLGASATSTSHSLPRRPFNFNRAFICLADRKVWARKAFKIKCLSLTILAAVLPWGHRQFLS